MGADGQVKSFIDRILRLKEEQDTLAADIREVYAEAKGNGYDKTAMGAVVAHLRKIEKHGADALEERDAAFSLYLDAYERASGTGFATHTHEAAPKLVETIVKGVQTEIGRKALVKALDAMIDAETGEITEQEQPETQSSVESRERQTVGVRAQGSVDSPISKPEATPKDRSLPSVGPSGTAALEFPLQTSPETGSAGDPSPTSGQMDLVEAGTGHNCAVLPQEPCTAEITPSAAPAVEPEAVNRTAPRRATVSGPVSHRTMSVSPLEPREAGGLKGFGFTVKFDDKPLNPDCRKAARGEQCALMHSQALCSKCQQAVDARRAA